MPNYRNYIENYRKTKTFNFFYYIIFNGFMIMSTNDVGYSKRSESKS